MKKLLNINNLIYAVLILVIYFLFTKIGNINKELARVNQNFTIAKTQFETRLDNLGNQYTVTQSSVMTRKEFDRFETDLKNQLNLIDVKTKNTLKAGLAGLQANYGFMPNYDTIFEKILKEINGISSYEIDPNTYTVTENYTDPKGWFGYEKINLKVNFWTKDSVFYATIKEKPLKPNGKPYFFAIRWLKTKEQKEVFKSLNPYSNINFHKVTEIK